MRIQVTNRAKELIDAAHGIDNYILSTPEYDLHSKLGCKLKRLMLLALARDEHAPDMNEETRATVLIFSVGTVRKHSSCR